jgi:hypothetical protein
MGRMRRTDRNSPAREQTSRPGRERPRPSVAQAARLTRVAGRDRRYAGRPDAEVMLALGQWGAMESWVCAQKIAATQEMIRRRPDRRAAVMPGGAAADADVLPAAWDKTLGEELALELSSSVYSGLALAELSFALKNRLPLTAAALEGGTLDMGKVRLIGNETAVLTDEQARMAEAEIAEQWDGLTWGELRDLVTAAVINADPEGARKRREEASKDARYRFCLDRGALTATLAGYSLPPADAIRADLGTRTGEPAPEAGARDSPDHDAQDDHSQDGDGEDGEDEDGRDDDSEDGDDGGSGPGGSGCGGGGAAACDDGLAANVDLIVPLADLAGYAQRAAQVRNLGGIDPELARTLTAMTARNPGSVFRVIITGPDGRAVAFGQAIPITPAASVTSDASFPRDRHTEGTQLPIPSLGPAADPPDNPDMPLASFTPAPGSRNRVTGQDGHDLWRLQIDSMMYTVRLDPVPGPGPCTHHYRAAGYKPGPVLRRLAEVRDGACMLPGCNLGLNCKKHNLMKRDPKWQVTQKPDGSRIWTTPGGLQYEKKPKTYPS